MDLPGLRFASRTSKLVLTLLTGGTAVVALGWWADSLIFPADSPALSRTNPASPTAFTTSTGQPIPPMVLASFLPDYITGNGNSGEPTVLAVNADTDEDQYTDPLAQIAVEEGDRWVTVSGPAEAPKMTLVEGETFGYRHLGRTTGGIDVVMTRDTCQYTSPGHVWILLLRRDIVPAPPVRGPSRTITRLRLVGYLQPAWRRCIDPKCGEEHTSPESHCLRHWAPQSRVEGDNLVTDWIWIPETWVTPQPIRPTTPPPPVIVNLANR